MMNNTMKRTVLSMFTAAILSSAGVAHADETGTVSMSGSVSSSTCTVTGLNGSLTFGNVSLADLQSAESLDTVTSVNIPISLTACPASVKGAKLVSTWNYMGGDARYMDYDGEMTGMALFVYPDPAVGYGGRMSSGDELGIDLSTSAADIVMQVRAVRNSQPASAGDYATAINYTMSFE